MSDIKEGWCGGGKRGARPHLGMPTVNCHIEGDEPGTGMKNGKPGHRSQLFKMQREGECECALRGQEDED